MKTISKRQQELVVRAVLTLHEQGTYPSATAINRVLGRRTKGLSGAECKARTVAFEKLGIRKRKN